jgi:hypothetical protein
MPDVRGLPSLRAKADAGFSSPLWPNSPSRVPAAPPQAQFSISKRATVPPYAGADCQGIAVHWGAACLIDNLNGTFLRTRDDPRDRFAGPYGRTRAGAGAILKSLLCRYLTLPPLRWGLRDSAVRLLITPMPTI